MPASKPLASPRKRQQQTLFAASSPPTVVKKKGGDRRQPTAQLAARAKTAAAAIATGAVAQHRLPLPDGSEKVCASWDEARAGLEMITLSMEHRKGGEAAAGLRELFETADAGEKVAAVQGSRVTQPAKLQASRRNLCESFAAKCKNLEKSKQRAPDAVWRVPQLVQERLLDLAYSQAVTAPKALNKYKPFSHEVYGETNYGLTNRIITVSPQHANNSCACRWHAAADSPRGCCVQAEGLKKDDVFFDLGSGVGQVVLQVCLPNSIRPHEQ